MIDKDKLYDWQKEAFQKWTENALKGIAVAPTGVGKTTYALFCMQTIRKKTIIIVPTIILMKQWKEEIMKQLQVPEEKIGFIGDGHREDKPITIAVINSVREEDLSRFYMVICDEIHRYGSIENIKPLMNSNFTVKLGITATLERQDNAEELLKQYIGNVIYKYEQKEAIQDNILNKFTLINKGVEMTPVEKKAYDESDLVVKNGMREFNYNFIELQKVVKNFRHPNNKTALTVFKAISERRKLYSNSVSKINAVVDLVMQHKNDKIIIFNEYIGMAETLYERLTEKNFLVGIYHSQTKDQEVVDDFANGKISVLVAVKSLNEGLNVKNANVGIEVSRNSVKRNIIQRLGRLIRKQEGKQAYFYQIYCRYTKEMDDVKKKSSLLSEIAEKIEWI